MDGIGNGFKRSIDRLQGICLKLINSWFQESLKIFSHDKSEVLTTKH